MALQLSVSCRIAEGFQSKEVPIMNLQELAELAVAAGYEAICMRASQVGVHSSENEIRQARTTLDDAGLGVTMVTGNFDIVYNNERGPACLQDIEPHLDLANALGAPLIRICIKRPEDIPHVQHAASLAGERGLKLVHQCHTQSLFETLDGIETWVREINHPSFGLIFEAANLELCGQPYRVASVERLSPWLENIYLQNQRLSPDGPITLESWHQGPTSFHNCEIYESEGIDFPTVFEGLRTVDYAGPITVHQSASENEGQSLANAKRTAEYLRGLIAST